MICQGEKMFEKGQRVTHFIHGGGVFIEYDTLDSDSANVKYDVQTSWGARVVCTRHNELYKEEYMTWEAIKILSEKEDFNKFTFIDNNSDKMLSRVDNNIIVYDISKKDCINPGSDLKFNVAWKLFFEKEQLVNMENLKKGLESFGYENVEDYTIHKEGGYSFRTKSNVYDLTVRFSINEGNIILHEIINRSKSGMNTPKDPSKVIHDVLQNSLEIK